MVWQSKLYAACVCVRWSYNIQEDKKKVKVLSLKETKKNSSTEEKCTCCAKMTPFTFISVRSFISFSSKQKKSGVNVFLQTYNIKSYVRCLR